MTPREAYDKVRKMRRTVDAADINPDNAGRSALDALYELERTLFWYRRLGDRTKYGAEIMAKTSNKGRKVKSAASLYKSRPPKAQTLAQAKGR